MLFICPLRGAIQELLQRLVTYRHIGRALAACGQTTAIRLRHQLGAVPAPAGNPAPNVSLLLLLLLMLM